MLNSWAQPSYTTSNIKQDFIHKAHFMEYADVDVAVQCVSDCVAEALIMRK